MSTPPRTVQVRFLNAEDLKPVFELDQYEGLVYVKRWQDLDEFELVLSGDSPQAVSLFSQRILPSRNRYVLSISIDFGDGLVRDFAGFIDVCEAEVAEGHHNWHISGNGLDRILSDRIIIPPVGASHDVYAGPAETIMKSLVDRHCVNPITTGVEGNEDEKRQIPLLSIEIDEGRGNIVAFDGRFQSLQEAFMEISRGGGDLGYSIDLGESAYTFKVSAGRDLTNAVIFSIGLDNLERLEYYEDGLDCANCVIIAGQGEEIERTVVTRGATGNAPVGTARREHFQDARDLDSAEKLRSRADSLLQTMAITKTFSASIRSEARPLYKSDWAVGDIVRLVNNAWNLNETVRVFEVEVTIEPNRGIRVVPQFARQRIALKDQIGRLASATGRN